MPVGESVHAGRARTSMPASLRLTTARPSAQDQIPATRHVKDVTSHHSFGGLESRDPARDPTLHFSYFHPSLFALPRSGRIVRSNHNN